jgi:hypothetical protein
MPATFDRAALAASWRRELNRIAALVGRPGLSPDESADGYIFAGVQALSRDHAALNESREHCLGAHGGDYLTKLAAGLDHHDEHHRREEELEAELAAALRRVAELEAAPHA